MTIKGMLPQWKSLNEVDRTSQGSLLGALLTTFDPPDPSVLIESYLPQWLGLQGVCTEEGDDRLRYFAELEDAMRRLKGRIAIISSPGATRSSSDGWVWNYIRRYEVGAERQATQHAKLWMFHRAAAEAGGVQTLEIVVSSANLTRDGLRGQIQGAWRCVLTLDPIASDANAQSWGCLPKFLLALGKSVGMGGQKVARQWVSLLRHCACPADVDFIASVPGCHPAAMLEQRETAWGTAGLRLLWNGKSSRRLTIFAPTIGHWTSDAFAQWAEASGVSPERVSLGWIRHEHPWARQSSWTLDASSEAALSKAGIRWLEVPAPTDDGTWRSPFCMEHQKHDVRWSHAKLYELRSGTQRRMLVTSANLSQSAWGKPLGRKGLEIRNFELGVAFPVADSFSDRLQEASYTRFTCDVDYARESEPPIAWLGAEWDGAMLRVSCRASDNLAPQVKVGAARHAGSRCGIVDWQGDEIAHATIAWPASEMPVPLAIHVSTISGTVRTVTVNDVRVADEAGFLCGEFDESTLSDALDDLVEERYGYQPASGQNGGRSKGKSRKDGTPLPGHYAVPAYVDARRRFLLIDNWWQELTTADTLVRPFILNDGRRIQRRWLAASETLLEQGLATAARIAAEELQLRLEMYQ